MVSSGNLRTNGLEHAGNRPRMAAAGRTIAAWSSAGFAGTHRIAAAPMHRTGQLRCLHAQICRVAETKPKILTHREVAHALEQGLIEVLVTLLSGASAKLLRHLARRRPRSGARGGAAVYGPRRKDACARSSTRWRAGRLLRSRARSRNGGL